LTSAQALGAASECFRAWLARDRTRRASLSWTVEGRTETIVLEASGLDEVVFAQLHDTLRARLDGR
jgi:aminoglycoside N3'-acetyltransferase